MIQFTEITHSDGRKALVREEWRETLTAALFDQEGCTPTSMGGRGTLLRFTFAGGTGLIRKCLRGGLLRNLTKDAFFAINRPLQELKLHAALYEAALPVPAPLGVVWRKSGFWYRGAVATQELPAQNLLEYLQSPRVHATPSILQKCGSLIRDMHDLGVFHPDLQIRNILVSMDATLVYLIDFDKAKRYRRLSDSQRSRNLLRLKRSFVKNHVSLDHFETLAQGYGCFVAPYWAEWVHDTKNRLSDKLAGRTQAKGKDES